MKYEEAKKLNDELTKITGVKHYPTIGEAFESVFKEKGIIDKNGNVVKAEGVTEDSTEYQGGINGIEKRK